MGECVRSDTPVRRPAPLPTYSSPTLPFFLPLPPPRDLLAEAAQPDRAPQAAEADAIDQQVDELKDALLRRAADLARTREYLARCVRLPTVCVRACVSWTVTRLNDLPCPPWGRARACGASLEQQPVYAQLAFADASAPEEQR